MPSEREKDYCRRVLEEERGGRLPPLMRVNPFDPSDPHDKTFLDTWERRLSSDALMLDFNDEEDRATFRNRVIQSTNILKVKALRELAQHYGASKVPTSRQGAAKALADAYMSRSFGIPRSGIDKQTYYTIWQKVGDHWVIERSFMGHYILSTYMDGIEKSWSTSRPMAVFPEGVDPNKRENPVSHKTWTEQAVDPGWPRTWMSDDGNWAIEARGGSYQLWDTYGMGKASDYWRKAGLYGDLDTAKHRAVEFESAKAFGPKPNPSDRTRVGHIEVIPSKQWRNVVTDQTASVYGAAPYTSSADKDNWVMETVGWTWYDTRLGTVGAGRRPAKTKEEAIRMAEKWTGKRANPAGNLEEITAFNTELAKELKKLKKTAGVTTMRQGYKGTGKQKFRRQIFVRTSWGPPIDLWLEHDSIRFGGVMTPLGHGGGIPYGDKTPQEVYQATEEFFRRWRAQKEGATENPQTGMTAKGRRMYEDVASSGSAYAPSAVVYAAAKKQPGTGLVTKQWAKEHGYPKPNPGRRDTYYRAESIPWEDILTDKDYAGIDVIERDSGDEIMSGSRFSPGQFATLTDRYLYPDYVVQARDYKVEEPYNIVVDNQGPNGVFRILRFAYNMDGTPVRNPSEIHFDGQTPSVSKSDTAHFLEESLGLSESDAKNGAQIIDDYEKGKHIALGPHHDYPHKGASASDILRWINDHGDGTHGVETIFEDDDGTLSTRYGNPVAEYVNTGDTYSGTVLYDESEDKFFLTTYGDWVERYEREQLEDLLENPEVYLDNMDREDGEVMAMLKGPHAQKIADGTQSIMGSQWECTDENFCYAIIQDYPNLVADLESGEDGPGWSVDESEYYAPDEDDED